MTASLACPICGARHPLHSRVNGERRCAFPGCEQTAIVGLWDNWYCIEHFNERLAQSKAALGAAAFFKETE